MPSKKFIEMQEFSNEELVGELNETQSQFIKMKFDHAVKGLDNPQLLKEMRRDIARLKTEMQRRAIEEGGDQEAKNRSKRKARRKRS